MSGKTSASAHSGVDRRIRRTRAALQRALLELLPRMRYEQITIDDVCEAADVGRSTFYAHYHSKDDLKRAAIDDHLAIELTERRRASGTASPTLVILEHVRDHRLLHRSLASRGASVAIEAVRGSLAQILREDNVLEKRESALDREFRVRYDVGAFMAVLLWWLERGAPEPPGQIENMFRALSERRAIRSREGPD